MDDSTKFHEQLTQAIEAYNRKHPATPVTLTDVIRLMGLKDPFVTKIRKGEYVPTKDRIELAAEALEINPAFFDLYTERWVVAEIKINPDLQTLIRRIAGIRSESARAMLIKGADRHISAAIEGSLRQAVA